MHTPSRRYGKLEAATTHLYERCGLRKWFVVSKSDDFLVHHMPDTYADRIGVSKQLFDEYVAAMCELGESELKRIQFPLATRLGHARFDKTHFEPIRNDILRIVRPSDRVLWVGSGSGVTESVLAERGIAISCVPLDSVHASVLRRRSLEVLDCISTAGDRTRVLEARLLAGRASRDTGTSGVARRATSRPRKRASPERSDLRDSPESWSLAHRRSEQISRRRSRAYRKPSDL